MYDKPHIIIDTKIHGIYARLLAKSWKELDTYLFQEVLLGLNDREETEKNSLISALLEIDQPQLQTLLTFYKMYATTE